MLDVLKHLVTVSSHRVHTDGYCYLHPFCGVMRQHLFRLGTFPARHWVPHQLLSLYEVYLEKPTSDLFSRYVKQDSVCEGTWKTL